MLLKVTKCNTLVHNYVFQNSLSQYLSKPIYFRRLQNPARCSWAFPVDCLSLMVTCVCLVVSDSL